MIMKVLPESREFEWDAGNKDKSWEKHRISLEESEQVFGGQDFILFDDTRHSLWETRQLIIGPTIARRLLSIIFTIRNHRIRVISARPASKKERKIYEETLKGSKIQK